MILITAFEPFNQRTTNNSMYTLKHIKTPADKVILPVSASRIEGALNELDLCKYDIIVMLGEANRKKVCIETVAHNMLDMKIKDNDNNQFHREIVLGGKAHHCMLGVTHKDAIISKDAGTFLCNMAYYLVLNHPSKAKKIFIHVPLKGDYYEIVEEIIDEIKAHESITG